MTNTTAASGGPNCRSRNCVLAATSGLRYSNIMRICRLLMQIRRSLKQTRNSVRLLTKRQSPLPSLRLPSNPSAPDLSVALLKQTLVLATPRSTQNPRSAVPLRIELSRQKRSHWSVRIQVRITVTLRHIQNRRPAVPARTMQLQLQGQSHWSVRPQAVVDLAESLHHATTTLPKLKWSVNAIIPRTRRRALRLGLLTVVKAWAITKSCDTRTVSERCVRCTS